MSEENYKPMSVGNWMLTQFIAALPIAGIIMIFIWAFGSGHHPSKSNWAKACLIWFAIGLGLGLIIIIISMSFMMM